ncbi:ankyrin repeat domain-containing protein [Stieleria sp. TO1_6]|uniref:ankyrin repeat domain-containing protein n=1 Tax=Stieleria tagensis TaxID=2956795 RepID=UPI00209B8561|nr:ankyrin repeat domain-containing protein [Stieleria tagensis]MCO8123062.1 ankyrin repeat domain-containing protein [Stieleria tagensis]
MKSICSIVLVLSTAGTLAFTPARTPAQTPAPLATAAEHQQWGRLSNLIDDDVAVDQAQPDGMTALHWAARWNHPIAISRLVAAGQPVDAATDYGVTPLAIACRYGNLNAATALLDLGADATQQTSGDETMLMHAARVGNASLVRALIDHGALVNAKQRDDQTALMWAAEAGHADVVGVLIDNGADFRHALRSGFTAFYFAVRQGHADAAAKLLDAGVDVNDRMNPQSRSERSPRKGTTALLLAVESGHFELALQLVDRGADPNDQRSGFAPLHALSWVRRPSRGDNAAGDPPPQGSGTVGSLQFARELVARGADVNLQLTQGNYRKAKLTEKGATPMLFAAFTSDLPYAQTLKELGADIQLANVDGTTPILAAAGVGIFVADEYPGTEDQTLAMIDQIVEWGGRINDTDQHGETVVHGAAYRSFPRVVDRLVELGAKPEHWYRDNSLGSTPRQLAQGKRPGSFKPNKATVAAIDRALKAAGIEPEEWERPKKTSQY